MAKVIRNGILAGGNWIIDQVKMVDVYPTEERLANILSENASNGGAPYNVLKALHIMEVAFPLEGVGVLGDDERGQQILEECQGRGINTDQLKKLKGVKTSYTDVMTVTSTGRRTFFHCRGSNALLDESHFDFSRSAAKFFHLGYLLLLDKLDTVGADGLTGAARLLRKAKEAGFVTSADIVSEQSERYKNIVPASLSFIDILFVNEFEAKMLADTEIFDKAGNLSLSRGYAVAEKILAMGVLGWVVVHFPRGAIAVSKAGERIVQHGVHLPPEKIKGTVGAGDAFAAGVLAGLHEEWGMAKSLELGVNVAAASLMDTTSSGGIVSWQQCMEIGSVYGYGNR